MRLKRERIDELVRACLKINRDVQEGLAHRFFPALPGIHDEADQESDFMEGVAIGVRKMRKDSWHPEDPIKFLVKNGLWRLRLRRWRAMRRKLVIQCQCGKRLRMSQKPCHGTMDDRRIRGRECPIGSTIDMVSIENELVRKALGTRRTFLTSEDVWFGAGV